MDTVIVSGSQFYSHFPRKIPKGSVDAEKVEIRLDSEWDGLTVRIHWLNVASNVERKPLLERDQPNTIPWEVLTDLGELRMGLVGLDGETVIKPTIWLTYGYVTDGVDPEAGEDPQPPTPSWEQQMVEQATQANQAAQDAKEYAQQVAESIESAGPYAEEAKKAAEAAKASETAAKGAADTATQQATKAQEAVTSIGNAVDQAQSAATAAGTAQSAAETAKEGAAQSAGTAQSAAVAAVQSAGTAQDAATKAGEYMSSAETAAGAATDAAIAAGQLQQGAQTAAQEASNARDQANTAATTAQGHADAAGTAKAAAEQAASTAGSAQAGAAQSAQAAASSASAAQAAQEGAENAAANAEEYAQQALASVLPDTSGVEDGSALVIEGGLPVWGAASGGGGEKLHVDYVHQGNTEIYFLEFDWATGIGTTKTPHGLSEATRVILSADTATETILHVSLRYAPYEFSTYTSTLYVVPVDENRLMVTKSDKTTPIVVNPLDSNNSGLKVDGWRFEVPVAFSITGFSVPMQKLHMQIFGFVDNKTGGMVFFQGYFKTLDGLTFPGKPNQNGYFAFIDVLMYPYQLASAPKISNVARLQTMCASNRNGAWTTWNSTVNSTATDSNGAALSSITSINGNLTLANDTVLRLWGCE